MKMNSVKGPSFVDAGTVQHVSASYLPTQGRVRLHIKAVEHDKPQDFLLALPELPARATQQLGQSLLALGASPSTGSA